MSAWVSRKMRSLVEVNAFCHGPDTRPGLMVNGGGCQGKTETVCEALACFEDEWLALYDQVPGAVAGTLDHHVPVAYVRTPVKATPISACQRILDFYGEDYKGMRLEDLHPHRQERGLRPRHQGPGDRRHHPAEAPPRGRPGRPGPHPRADEPARHPHPGRRRDPQVRAAARRPQGPPDRPVAVPAGQGPRQEPQRRRPRPDRPAVRPASTSTGSATAPRTASPPGPPTSSASSSSSGSCTATTACSATAPCPSTCSAAPAASSACSGNSSRKACRHAIETGAEKITTGLLDTLTVSPADLPGLDPDAGEIPHIPPARPAATENSRQAAEHRLRRSRRPHLRDRGLTDHAPCPAAGQKPGPAPRRVAARVPPAALLPASASRPPGSPR